MRVDGAAHGEDSEEIRNRDVARGQQHRCDDAAVGDANGPQRVRGRERETAGHDERRGPVQQKARARARAPRTTLATMIISTLVPVPATSGRRVSVGRFTRSMRSSARSLTATANNNDATTAMSTFASSAPSLGRPACARPTAANIPTRITTAGRARRTIRRRRRIAASLVAELEVARDRTTKSSTTPARIASPPTAAIAASTVPAVRPPTFRRGHRWRRVAVQLGIRVPRPPLATRSLVTHVPPVLVDQGHHRHDEDGAR